MEQFGQCLRAWMEAEDISSANLANILGYKSKTSVLRMLRGENSLEVYQRMLEQLNSRLDGAWRMRFQSALRVERIGIRQAEMIDALDRQFFGVETAADSIPSLPLPPEVRGGRLIIFGYPHPGLLDMAERLLASGVQSCVYHYITEGELLRNPPLLTGLIRNIGCSRYQALLVDPQAIHTFSWGLALYIPAKGRETWSMLFGGHEPRWRRLEGADDFCREDALSFIPLYRFDKLENGSDYLRFTEDAYRIERGKSAVIMKPTPGMQMLPADTVESTFRDYLAENLEPVSAMQDTLIRTFEKRVHNFYYRRQRTLLYLSAEAMTTFARTGFLSDHFFAFRPYTVSERISCLEALRDFARRDGTRLCLREGPMWPVSFEAYGENGVFLYPSQTNYNSNDSDYRELYLPGKAFADLFEKYADEYLFPPDVDSKDQLEPLIAAARAAE